MGHPASCKDSTCTLSYRDHLLSINFGATAFPTRRITHTEGLPDEPVTQTLTREKRIERDTAAYRRLHAQGYRPRRVEGSALRERHGETEYDVTNRRVKIDYEDAS